jgi:hypothetical protein
MVSFPGVLFPAYYPKSWLTFKDIEKNLYELSDIRQHLFIDLLTLTFVSHSKSSVAVATGV